MGVQNAKRILAPHKFKLYTRYREKLDNCPRGGVVSTPTVNLNANTQPLPSLDFLLKNPVYFPGKSLSWGCTQKWSKDFFFENYPRTVIPLVNKIPGIRDDKGKYPKITFSEYQEALNRGESLYLSFSRVLDHNTELLKDLDVDWLRQFKHGLSNGEQTFFFMGESGSKTDLHNGFTHTLFIQVKGRKKWTVFAPEERFFIDPVAGRHTHFYSHANPNDLNATEYPLLRHAKRYEVILNPGDVLWIPSLYWHYVENLDESIGVAFKFVNVPQAFRISKVLTSLIFLATKPNLLTSFLYNKFTKEDYVFHN